MTFDIYNAVSGKLRQGLAPNEVGAGKETVRDLSLMKVGESLVMSLALVDHEGGNMVLFTSYGVDVITRRS